MKSCAHCQAFVEWLGDDPSKVFCSNECRLLHTLEAHGVRDTEALMAVRRLASAERREIAEAYPSPPLMLPFQVDHDDGTSSWHLAAPGTPPHHDPTGVPLRECRNCEDRVAEVPHGCALEAACDREVFAWRAMFRDEDLSDQQDARYCNGYRVAQERAA